MAHLREGAVRSLIVVVARERGIVASLGVVEETAYVAELALEQVAAGEVRASERVGSLHTRYCEEFLVAVAEEVSRRWD